MNLKNFEGPYKVVKGRFDLFQVWKIEGPKVPFGMTDWPSKRSADEGCEELNAIYGGFCE